MKTKQIYIWYSAKVSMDLEKVSDKINWDNWFTEQLSQINYKGTTSQNMYARIEVDEIRYYRENIDDEPKNFAVVYKKPKKKKHLP